MNVMNYFKEQQEEHKVPFQLDWAEKLIAKYEYDKVEKGVWFPDTRYNRILRSAIDKMTIPSYYIDKIIDHAYSLTSSNGTAYHYRTDCIISCYYNPNRKKKALKMLQLWFEEVFWEAEQQTDEYILIYENGLYDKENTFGIFIPGSVLQAYLKLLIEKNS